MSDRLLSSSLGPVWTRLQSWSAPEHRIELAAVMTLLLSLLYSEDIWYLEVGVYGLSLAALLYRPLLHKPALWFGITVFLVVGHGRGWYFIDNHKYLITYWCLAFGLALLASDPLRTLRTNARLLIGLAFAFAVLAKLLSPDYLDGTFFANLVLSDQRFFHVTSFLSGISVGEIRTSSMLRQDLLAFGDLTDPIGVLHTPRLWIMAQVLTWWTIFIEAVIAVLFLWPLDRGPSRWRDPALLMFMITTYPVAPVLGFAWVLAAMGTAQSTAKSFRYGPVLYAVAFIVLMVISYMPIARAFAL